MPETSSVGGLGAPISVVTANLYRLANPYPWIGRRRRVVKLLDGASPDVILFQECPERESWIAAKLTGAYREASDHVNCPILANSERFDVVSRMGFNLRGTERKRYGSGLVVEEHATGQRMCFVSVHPSSRKERNAALDRPKQIKELLTKLASWKVDGVSVIDLPLFIGGDMNCSEPSTKRGGVAHVMTTHGLVDARDVLTTEKKFKHREYRTSSGWSMKPKKGPQIDRGYASPHLSFEWAQVIFTGRAADHNFVHWIIEVGPHTPPTIEELIPNFATLPADAQLAAQSIAANVTVGVQMFNPTSEGYWPNLTKGLKALDLWTCVDNSSIRDRDVEYNRGNRILFMQAVRVNQFDLDRAVALGRDVTISAGAVAAADPAVFNIDAWWVQAMLRELGHYTEKVDGLFGPFARAAFAEFTTADVTLETVLALSEVTLNLTIGA